MDAIIVRYTEQPGVVRNAGTNMELSMLYSAACNVTSRDESGDLVVGKPLHFIKTYIKMIPGKGLGSAIYFMFVSNSADNKQRIIHEKYIGRFGTNNPAPKLPVFPLPQK